MKSFEVVNMFCWLFFYTQPIIVCTYITHTILNQMKMRYVPMYIQNKFILILTLVFMYIMHQNVGCTKKEINFEPLCFDINLIVVGKFAFFGSVLKKMRIENLQIHIIFFLNFETHMNTTDDVCAN